MRARSHCGCGPGKPCALARAEHERERRRRYARVRNARDSQRRTLVGAHMPLEEAERVAWLANIEGLSTTAYVKRALELAGRQTMHEASDKIYGYGMSSHQNYSKRQ